MPGIQQHIYEVGCKADPIIKNPLGKGPNSLTARAASSKISVMAISNLLLILLIPSVMRSHNSINPYISYDFSGLALSFPDLNPPAMQYADPGNRTSYLNVIFDKGLTFY